MNYFKLRIDEAVSSAITRYTGKSVDIPLISKLIFDYSKCEPIHCYQIFIKTLNIYTRGIKVIQSYLDAYELNVDANDYVKDLIGFIDDYPEIREIEGGIILCGNEISIQKLIALMESIIQTHGNLEYWNVDIERREEYGPSRVTASLPVEIYSFRKLKLWADLDLNKWKFRSGIKMGMMFARSSIKSLKIDKWNVVDEDNSIGAFRNAKMDECVINDNMLSSFAFYESSIKHIVVKNATRVCHHTLFEKASISTINIEWNKPLRRLYKAQRKKRLIATSARGMFRYAHIDDWSFLRSFDMSQVENTENMFDASNFDDLTLISNWVTSNLKDATNMFLGVKFKHMAVLKWCTDKLKKINGMFEKTRGFEYSMISHWKYPKTTHAMRWFYESDINPCEIKLDMPMLLYADRMFAKTLIENTIIRISAPALKNARYMLTGCTRFKGIDFELRCCNLKHGKSIFSGNSMFDGDVGTIQFADNADVSGAFYNCHHFTGKGIDKWRPFTVSDISRCFKYCPMVFTDFKWMCISDTIKPGKKKDVVAGSNKALTDAYYAAAG
jgi:hypothetical protein